MVSSTKEGKPSHRGFCGAPIVETSSLGSVSAPGDIAFFGVDTEVSRWCGTANRGSASFVRRHTACMSEWAEAYGAKCYDVGVLTCESGDEALHAAGQVSGYVASLGRRPAMIGCDHTVSMAGVMGAAIGTGTSPVYLFFDAHFDLGRHYEPMLHLHNGNFVNFLLESEQISQVVNVGGRSPATRLPIYGDLQKFTHIPAGIHGAKAPEIIEALSHLTTVPLYVSIDADVLDPSCAPNLTCYESDGMMIEDLVAVCQWIGQSCQVIGGDLTEILPSHNSRESEITLMKCLHSVLTPQ